MDKRTICRRAKIERGIDYKFSQDHRDVALGYADCFDFFGVSQESRNRAFNNRKLHFYTKEVPLETVTQLIELVEQYNDFDAKRVNMYLRKF